jgi:A/G-specific adenine glycosylase
MLPKWPGGVKRGENAAMHPFARAIVRWQPRHGRRGMPWQGATDPYRVWLSEIMLQQTQVEAVVPYYERFLARFPDVASLARAREQDVLRLWSGLGYYARARNLHAAARRVCREHGGRFPDTPEGLAALPGIGRSSAAAIAVFAFGQRAAILDGNVKRVLARCFGIAGDSASAAGQRALWDCAERLVPARAAPVYTQGLMDLGATICRRARPHCGACAGWSRCKPIACCSSSAPRRDCGAVCGLFRRSRRWTLRRSGARSAAGSRPCAACRRSSTVSRIFACARSRSSQRCGTPAGCARRPDADG